MHPHFNIKMKSPCLHRINFFEPEPTAVRCLSYDESTSRIAVSRSDSSIEIWDVRSTPYQEKIIPGSSDVAIQAICWCNGRLFSSALNGYIYEHDKESLLPKYQLLVTSGCPIWCMAANEKKTQIAVGNEDGHVVLHDVSPDGLHFSLKFDKQEGSILCLDWHKEGKIIVTGSIDAIRTWNVDTGHVINRILLSRARKNEPTVVWCVALTKDMTIISGDSCGKTSFWDGNTGALLSSTESKKGDIISLAVSKGEDVIYTSGVEPTITMFLQSQSNGKWMKSIQRVVHTHDVRALQLVGDLLVSGGDDCNLVCTKYPPKIVLTFYPYCQRKYAVVAADASCILLQYPNYVELWKIGSQNPTNLLRVKPRTNEKVISSSMSTNGKWLAYSTEFQIRLFSVQMDEKSDSKPSISKIDLPGNLPSFSNVLLFTKDSSKLICYGENKMYIISCDPEFTNVVNTLDEEPGFSGQIHLMDVSNYNSYLACGAHNGCIVIYCLKSLKKVCSLPLYSYQPTAMSFSPSSESLVVAYNDRKIVEYSISKGGYTSWSKQQVLQDFKEASLYPIISMCFCGDKLYLQDENTIYAFDRKEQVTPGRKRVKQSERDESVITEGSYKTITKYQHISSIHSFHEDLVIVQMSATHVLNSLPPPVWKKVYGT